MMSNKNSKQANTGTRHSDIYQLLPWYVNDSMDSQQRRVVETHVETCITCHLEVEQLRQLSEIVRDASDSEQAARASFARLQTRIDQPASKTQVKTRFTWEYRQWLEYLLRRPARSLVLMLLFILLPTLLSHNIDSGNRASQEKLYQTLSSHQARAKKNSIRVVFADSVDNTEMQQILTPLNLQIIAGPSLHGAYQVRLNEDESLHALEPILQALQNNSRIIFAEPAYALLTPSNASATTATHK